MKLRRKPRSAARWVALSFLPLASACVHRPPTPLPAELRAAPPGRVQRRVVVDDRRDEVVVFAGPFHVAAAPAEADHAGGGDMPPHDHAGMARTPMIDFRWPIEGWMRGFRLSLVDAEGNEYPRSLMHHLIGVNYDRRELVYPVAERLFGVGTETADVVLPKSLGVPLDEGAHLGFYVMWNNQTPEELNGLFIRLSMPYTLRGKRHPVEVLPFYADVNNRVGQATSFDLPPGRTVRSYVFTVPVSGGLVAASGHLHDYGVALRLEDVETGKQLFALKGNRDRDGHMKSVQRRIFGIRKGRVHLEAGRRYRVVGEYMNPTGRTLHSAAMAHISGIFAPERRDAWPAIDADDPLYLRDLATLPKTLAQAQGDDLMEHGPAVDGRSGHRR